MYQAEAPPWWGPKGKFFWFSSFYFAGNRTPNTKITIRYREGKVNKSTKNCTKPKNFIISWTKIHSRKAWGPLSWKRVRGPEVPTSANLPVWRACSWGVWGRCKAPLMGWRSSGKFWIFAMLQAILRQFQPLLKLSISPSEIWNFHILKCTILKDQNIQKIFVHLTFFLEKYFIWAFSIGFLLRFLFSGKLILVVHELSN